MNNLNDNTTNNQTVISPTTTNSSFREIKPNRTGEITSYDVTSSNFKPANRQIERINKHQAELRARQEIKEAKKQAKLDEIEAKKQAKLVEIEAKRKVRIALIETKKNLNKNFIPLPSKNISSIENQPNINLRRYQIQGTIHVRFLFIKKFFFDDDFLIFSRRTSIKHLQ